jgi:hypothetical protein
MDRVLNPSKVEGTKVIFQTGRIANTPYVVKKDRSVINVEPKFGGIKRKKDRILNRRIMSEKPGGHSFVCHCKRTTYHFPSEWISKTEVMAEPSLTYECCLCRVHYTRSTVDEQMASRPTA